MVVHRRTALLSVSTTARDVIVEAGNVPHALLQLGLSEAISRHSDQLIRPVLLQLANFATGHDDGAGEREHVILQEFILLHDQIREHLTVVSELLHCEGHGTHACGETV